MDKLIASLFTAAALLSLDALLLDQRAGRLTPNALARVHAFRTYLDAIEV